MSLKVVLFGATGMVGQGVLRECLLDSDVAEVLCVGRSAVGRTHPKLREVLVSDLMETSGFEARLGGFDACFFCMGVSAFRMKEADYRRLTFDLTLGVARTLARLNPGMTFIYVSGVGTDSSEHGRIMWARVKGETENAFAPASTQGGDVSTGTHRGAAWHPVQDHALPHHLLARPSLLGCSGRAVSTVRDHHRKGWEGDARGGSLWGPEAHPGASRHQRLGGLEDAFTTSLRRGRLPKARRPRQQRVS